MEIQIRRIDKDLPLPLYKTPGAVAMDCVARVDVTIPAQEVGYVPLNFALKPPPDHFVLMAARSSLHKRGLSIPNGVGIFDEDYCGDEDEYQAVLFNFMKDSVEIKRGERLTQIIVLPYVKAALKEVDTLGHKSRGGFGTTGK